MNSNKGTALKLLIQTIDRHPTRERSFVVPARFKLRSSSMVKTFSPPSLLSRLKVHLQETTILCHDALNQVAANSLSHSDAKAAKECIARLMLKAMNVEKETSSHCSDFLVLIEFVILSVRNTLVNPSFTTAVRVRSLSVMNALITILEIHILLKMTFLMSPTQISDLYSARWKKRASNPLIV